MITLKVIEKDEDLGLHIFLAVPRIGDKLILRTDGDLAPYRVLGLLHLPIALHEKGDAVAPEIWLHVEFDI